MHAATTPAEMPSHPPLAVLAAAAHREVRFVRRAWALEAGAGEELSEPREPASRPLTVARLARMRRRLLALRDEAALALRSGGLVPRTDADALMAEGKVRPEQTCKGSAPRPVARACRRGPRARRAPRAAAC